MNNEKDIEFILDMVKNRPKTKQNANTVKYHYQQLGGKWNHCFCSTRHIKEFYNHLLEKYDS